MVLSILNIFDIKCRDGRRGTTIVPVSIVMMMVDDALLDVVKECCKEMNYLQRKPHLLCGKLTNKIDIAAIL